MIASLKARAAAFPDPQTIAMMNGPRTADAIATDCDPFMASIREPVRPIDFIPAAKSDAAAIRITTLLNPSPAPLQNCFDTSPGSCLCRMATIRPRAVPISMQTGTEKVFVGSQPTSFEAITRRKSGTIGMIAMIGLIWKFFRSTWASSGRKSAVPTPSLMK